MRGTSHQGARCYQRIRSQFLTSSRVNTHGRSPECGRRSKARRSGARPAARCPVVRTGVVDSWSAVRDLAGVLASSSAASRSCLFFHSLQIMSAIHPRRPPTPTARVVMAARPRPTTGRDRPTNPDAPAHHSRGPAVMPTSSASPFTRQCRSTESRSCLRPRAKRRACVPALASL